MSTATFITPEALLQHWLGHRRVTRRVIQAFPESELFTFSIGGMRPFGELAMEMIAMGAPMVRGVVTGEWDASAAAEPRTRDTLLRLWDDGTAEIERLWKEIPQPRFQETVNAFGQYEGALHDLLLYVIDNEIHHRGQGYVYLRALGVTPPAFYERGVSEG